MNELWACEPECLRSYANKVLCADRETVIKAAAAYASRGDQDDILAVAGDTATIQIAGTLSQRTSVIGWLLGFGGTSYGDIINAVGRAAANDSIRKVILAINSPGGNIMGLDEVWSAVRALGERKRVIAENRGLMASAAYWIASAAHEIRATSPSALTGSIGVQMVLHDWSEADKREGLREIRIVSSNAPNKNPDPTTKEGRAVYQDELDALERVFISRVAAGRKKSDDYVIDNFGQGGLLIADDPDSSKKSAISVGMIDGIVGQDDEKKSRKIDGIFSIANSDIKDSAAVRKVEENMTLAELLAAHPELKVELDSLELAAYNRGVAETRKRGTQATSVLAADKYPSAIKGLAAQVLGGEQDPAVLMGAVVAYDAYCENDKQRNAKADTDSVAATPAEPPTLAANDGEIRTEIDHLSSVNQIRAARGQKVLS